MAAKILIHISGKPNLWPKPHLFEEANEGFHDIGPFGKPNFPADNPYSVEKEELGKHLFFDPRLSQSGQISELSDLENFLKKLHSYQYKMRAPGLPKK